MAKKSSTYYYGYNPNDLYKKFKNLYVNKYYNIFMNSLEWQGLTREEEEYIMRQFYSKGTVSAFDLKNVGLAFAPYAVCGYGLYDVPTELNIINTRNVPGFPVQPLTNGKEVVIGYIQRNRKSIYEFVDFYASRMAQVDMVINTNLELQKLPFLIGIDDSDKENATNIIRKILNNELVVFANMEELQQVKSFVNGAPYVIDKLFAFKNNLESELLTFLGVDNSQIDVDKLAVDQINANNEMINTNAKGFERELNKWCEDIQDILGYEISVKLTHQPVESVHQDMDKSNSNMEDKNTTGGTL